MLITYEGRSPVVHATARVAENAALVGSVALENRSNIWYGAVLRGDEGPIRVGENSNVQDNVVVHAETDHPVSIGRDVTVGHGAILHGCTLEDGCLIGMGAILLNGCIVGEGALVAAGALVAQGKVIPPHCLVIGSPARVVRPLTDRERAGVAASSAEYLKLSAQLPAG